MPWSIWNYFAILALVSRRIIFPDSKNTGFPISFQESHRPLAALTAGPGEEAALEARLHGEPGSAFLGLDGNLLWKDTKCISRTLTRKCPFLPMSGCQQN